MNASDIKIKNLNKLIIKKSEKKINRLERLVTLLALSMSYSYYTKAVLYSKADNSNNSYQAAESISGFVNLFSRRKTQPVDFIHDETEEHDKALLNYDKFKECIAAIEYAELNTSKQITAFCKAVEYNNRFVLLRISGSLYYPAYFTRLFQYVRGDIAKDQLHEVFYEYSISSGQMKRTNLALLRKTIRNMEALFNEICDKQSSREIRKR